MIMSCFLCVEQKIIADYYNSDNKSRLLNKEKNIHDFL